MSFRSIVSILMFFSRAYLAVPNERMSCMGLVQ